MRAYVLPILVLVSATVVACDDGSSCVEGASAACACPNGEQGAQVCSADGTYGACVCDGQVDAGPARADASTPAVELVADSEEPLVLGVDQFFTRTLYWIEDRQVGRLMSVPLDGSSPPQHLVDAGSDIRGLSLNGERFTWISHGNAPNTGVVAQTSMSSPGVITTLATNQNGPVALVSPDDLGGIWVWANEGTGSPTEPHADASIVRMFSFSHEPQTIVQSRERLHALAMCHGYDNLFWGDTEGFHRLDFGHIPGEPLPAPLFFLDADVLAVTASATQVFAARAEGLLRDQYSIIATTIDGYERDVLYRDSQPATALVWDGDEVLASSSQGLIAIDPVTGAVRVLAGQAEPVGIAYDDAFVYWADKAGGIWKVMRQPE